MSEHNLYWVKLSTEVVVAARSEEEAVNKKYIRDIDPCEFDAIVYRQITNPEELPSKWEKTSIPYMAGNFDDDVKTISEIFGESSNSDDSEVQLSMNVDKKCSSCCGNCDCSTEQNENDDLDDMVTVSVDLDEEYLPLVTKIVQHWLREYLGETNNKLDGNYSTYEELFAAVGEIFTITSVTKSIEDVIRDITGDK